MKNFLIDKKKRIIFIFFIILSIIVILPSLKAGICLTDEIELRLNNVIGYIYACKNIINQAIVQGRITNSIPFILFSNIAFRFESSLYFRSVNAIIILSNFISISSLINKLTKNKILSYMLFIFLLICLPFTFEHTIPNGFVAFIGFPFTLLIVSFIFFMKYLENCQKKYIVISSIFLLLALCSYEVFIMYTPIFLLLILYKRRNSIKYIISNIYIPMFTSIFYLIIYVIQGKIFPTTYEGNTLYFKSLSSTFEIIWNLFKTGIPGFFSWTTKYQYIYHAGNRKGNEISYFINNGLSLRILLIVFIGIILSVFLYKSKEKNKENKKVNYINLLLVSLAYMFIPSIPNSLSSFYQGRVNENAFMALPVSYFIYIAGCIVSVIILYSIINKFKKLGMIIIILEILLVVIPVQLVNEKVLEQQTNYYTDYLFVEEMLGTDSIKAVIEDKEVAAKDLYNILAMRPTYWELAAKALYGYNTHFNNTYDIDADTYIQWYDNDYFYVISGNLEFVVSRKPLQRFVLRSLNDEWSVFFPVTGFYDKDLIIYNIER